jgi:hypothetical protein
LEEKKYIEIKSLFLIVLFLFSYYCYVKTVLEIIVEKKIKSKN